MRRDRYQSGPLVWVAIIAVTCLLLFLFQKILWLVVPFLFALIGYYLLRPLQERLILGGKSRDTAAVLVSAGAFAVLGIVLVFVVPLLSAQVGTWRATSLRYLNGGLDLLAHTLAWAEQNLPFAERTHPGEQLSRQLAEFGDKLAGTYLTSAAMNAAAWLPSLLLPPFLAFFLLRDGWRFKMFLSRAVPNAFFERSLFLLDRLDHTARLYFQGLIRLTVLDAACLAGGLALIGVSGPILLGVVTAVLAWIPYVGSIVGCLLVVLVAATDFPGQPAMAYAAIGLFVIVRLLDDFLFMPLTIGRSLKMHPLLTVVMIFVGGAVAGIAGLMLVLPLLGIVMVLGESIGEVVTDPRLRARHEHAQELRRRQVTADLLL